MKKSRPQGKTRPQGKSGAPRAAQFGQRRPPAPRGTGRTRSVVGTVTANRAGFGFLRSDEMAESVFLPPREMSRLMHGDRVRVTAAQGSDERWSGQVEEVLERGVTAFLATVSISGR